MLFLLDTDTCSYAIRGTSAVLDAKIAGSRRGTLVISAMTRAELMFGLQKRGNPRALSRLVLAFMERLRVLPWDANAADRYAELQALLERSGTPIGLFDAMIAGHALSLKATLISNNVRHFARVRGLKVENWSA